MEGVAAFVLAGGTSSRMGSEKALLDFGGRTLLDRALELARLITPEVRIVGPRAKWAAWGDVVEDIIPDCGPLGGIHAALSGSIRDLNLMLAVDTPFLQADFLRYLLEAACRCTATVTVPRAGGRLQTLSAIYRPAFAARAEEALRAGRYRVDRLFEPADTLIVDEAEIVGLSFPATMFENLNTREEYERACPPARISDHGSGKG